MQIPKKICFLLILASVGTQVDAQLSSLNQLDGRVNTINTAVPFLRISPDARSGAMGDAGIGLSPDASSIYWNTAKLAFAEEDMGLSVSYTPWLRELVPDIYLAHLGAYKRIDKLSTLALGLKYFSLGNIAFTDISGNPIGDFSPHEYHFAVGYARKLSESFSTGINLSYVYSNLASGYSVSGNVIKPGIGAAADISFMYHNDHIKIGDGKSTLNIGATISNIGNKITYTANAQNKDFMPTDLGIGGGLIMKFDDFNRLTAILDINKLLVPTPDSAGTFRNLSVPAGIFGSFSDAPGGFTEEFHELMYSGGLEYWYSTKDNKNVTHDLFAIRAGYYNEHKLKGNRKYLTAGVGIKYSVFGLNFSYLIPTSGQKNPLDNTLRFSLIFDFDKLGKGDKDTSATPNSN